MAKVVSKKRKVSVNCDYVPDVIYYTHSRFKGKFSNLKREHINWQSNSRSCHIFTKTTLTHAPAIFSPKSTRAHAPVNEDSNGCFIKMHQKKIMRPRTKHTMKIFLSRQWDRQVLFSCFLAQFLASVISYWGNDTVITGTYNCVIYFLHYLSNYKLGKWTPCEQKSCFPNFSLLWDTDRLFVDYLPQSVFTFSAIKLEIWFPKWRRALSLTGGAIYRSHVLGFTVVQFTLEFMVQNIPYHLNYYDVDLGKSLQQFQWRCLTP